MPYNRVIKSLQNKNEEDIFASIMQNFEIRVIDEGSEIAPSEKG